MIGSLVAVQEGPLFTPLIQLLRFASATAMGCRLCRMATIDRARALPRGRTGFRERPESARLPRCRALQRRSPNRAHSRRSASGAGSGLNAPKKSAPFRRLARVHRGPTLRAGAARPETSDRACPDSPIRLGTGSAFAPINHLVRFGAPSRITGHFAGDRSATV